MDKTCCNQNHIAYPPIEILSVEESKEILACLSKGLAHPARVEIVKFLAKQSPRSRCICGDIVGVVPLAQSSVSQHLKMLKKTGWIQGTLDGPCVCYCLVDGIVDYYDRLIHRTIQRPAKSDLKDNCTITNLHRETT
ncbi:MAG: winged helix-turn-helix transcriptional regulator [Deltaproteobacteria bacterium]|nr:winged helix-turn-helix transcriptional regulator [Deltaproteobacteria bacterium]